MKMLNVCGAAEESLANTNSEQKEVVWHQQHHMLIWDQTATFCSASFNKSYKDTYYV